MALPASLFTLALESLYSNWFLISVLPFFIFFFSLFRIYSVCAQKNFHDGGTSTDFLVLERKFP